MGWVRIDDTHQDHPKLVEAGPFAELLDVRAICWSSRFETDGRIPRSALKQLARGMRGSLQAQKLVNAGRWRPTSRRDGFDGWIIHGYLEAQPSKAERDAERAAARERAAASRARRNGQRAANVRRTSGARSEQRHDTVRSTPQTPQQFEGEPPLTDDQRANGRRQARAAADRLRQGDR